MTVMVNDEGNDNICLQDESTGMRARGVESIKSHGRSNKMEALKKWGRCGSLEGRRMESEIMGKRC